MTETGGTVERLDWIRKHHERFPTDVCPSDVVVSCSDIAALLAVVEAAQEYRQQVIPNLGDDDERTAAEELDATLAALHSQASDEGST